MRFVNVQLTLCRLLSDAVRGLLFASHFHIKLKKSYVEKRKRVYGIGQYFWHVVIFFFIGCVLAFLLIHSRHYCSLSCSAVCKQRTQTLTIVLTHSVLGIAVMTVYIV